MMPSATSSIAFPPDEPACLFRASLVRRTWHVLLSEPSFLRRYREHHRASPVLGFLYNKRFVPTTAAEQPFSHLTGAVLCAANGCDHTDCRRDPFFVVFGGTADEEVMEDASATWVSVYSSETGMWRVPAWIHLGPISRSHDVIGPSLLIGNALHFLLEDGRRILKYESGGHDLSVMNTPPLRVGNMALVMRTAG